MAQSNTDRQRPVRKFKGVTVIEWDTEPAEERPSRFADSTLYSDFYGTPRRTHSRGRQSSGGGVGGACLALAAVLAVAAGGLLGLVQLLQR